MTRRKLHPIALVGLVVAFAPFIALFVLVSCTGVNPGGGLLGHVLAGASWLWGSGLVIVPVGVIVLIVGTRMGKRG